MITTRLARHLRSLPSGDLAFRFHLALYRANWELVEGFRKVHR